MPGFPGVGPRAESGPGDRGTTTKRESGREGMSGQPVGTRRLPPKPARGDVGACLVARVCSKGVGVLPSTGPSRGKPVLRLVPSPREADTSNSGGSPQPPRWCGAITTSQALARQHRRVGTSQDPLFGPREDSPVPRIEEEPKEPRLRPPSTSKQSRTPGTKARPTNGAAPHQPSPVDWWYGVADHHVAKGQMP